MTKVALVKQMIEKRIAHSDHVLTGIPGERQLAEEIGMSRTTVRTAIRHLVKQGTLTRSENGRLSVSSSTTGLVPLRTIGFVAPAVASMDYEHWRNGVKGALEGYPATLRPVSYAHWADPSVQDALSGFDGLFFIPLHERIPAWLTSKMADSSCRVVVLDQDETSAGLPSVRLFTPSSERKLFDHLYALGHRRIDCLNTQTEDDAIQGRISEWQSYLKERGVPGQLRSFPESRPFETAYRLISDALREGRPVASALFCTTGPAAIGAMRAFHEFGLQIGVDVSVCAVNGEGLGRYLLRTLTELVSPPRASYLRAATEWMLGDEDWKGPLLIQPNDVVLFEGESTGPAPGSPIITPP